MTKSLERVSVIDAYGGNIIHATGNRVAGCDILHKTEAVHIFLIRRECIIGTNGIDTFVPVVDIEILENFLNLREF